MSKRESVFDQMMKDKEFKSKFEAEKKRIGKYYSDGLVPMHTIDRALVIIKKKKPYLDWVRQLPDSDLEVTLKNINEEPTCYLLPYCGDHIDDLVEYVKTVFPELFEAAMNEWWTEEEDWEQDLTWVKFKKWFSFEITSMPIDLGEGEILREEF